MADKVIVCQIGARHRYLIPQVLFRSGMLCKLYTDSTNKSFLGRVASGLSKFGVKSAAIQRLVRRVPNLPDSFLNTSDVLTYKQWMMRMMGGSKYDLIELPYRGIADKCRQWGTEGADCVYGMYFENFEFLKYAKSQGLKVVVDIYERPMTYKLISDEIRQNTEYSVFKDMIESNEIKHAIRMKYIENLLALADHYTVPSKYVIESLKTFSNFDINKVHLQPYASSITTKEYQYNPHKHRVLFVGSDPVIKGLLYCAKAASILKAKYPDLDFRIAGGGPDIEKIKQHDSFRDLLFIGFLNKSDLEKEYREAEVFVFPTLFEGFAGSIIEAASCGCPIVTTRNAGGDPDEFPAIFIREKNVEDIVVAVSKVFDNNLYRDTLSKTAYTYSSVFSPQKYTESLVSFLKTV